MPRPSTLRPAAICRVTKPTGPLPGGGAGAPSRQAAHPRAQPGFPDPQVRAPAPHGPPDPWILTLHATPHPTLQAGWSSLFQRKQKSLMRQNMASPPSKLVPRRPGRGWQGPGCPTSPPHGEDAAPVAIFPPGRLRGERGCCPHPRVIRASTRVRTAGSTRATGPQPGGGPRGRRVSCRCQL